MCSDELFFQNERPELLQDTLLAFGIEVRMHLIRRASDLHFKRIFSAEIHRVNVQCWLIHAATPLSVRLGLGGAAFSAGRDRR